MATYSELATISQQSGFGALQEKVRAAVAIRAVAYLQGTPTAAQVDWAKSALMNPAAAAEDVTWYVIAANDSATVAQILAATDSAVQTNVDAAVNAIMAGGA